MYAMVMVIAISVGTDSISPLPPGEAPIGYPEVRAAWPAPHEHGPVMNNAATLPSVEVPAVQPRISDMPAGPYQYTPPRDPQADDGLIRGFFKYCQAWFEPMPQTCYSPHFGCYPCNARHSQRYPAFHGYYYRQAYNYRPLFEYPWQAGMHEPLPLEINSPRSLIGKPSEPAPTTEVIQAPVANNQPRISR